MPVGARAAVGCLPVARLDLEALDLEALGLEGARRRLAIELDARAFINTYPLQYQYLRAIYTV